MAINTAELRRSAAHVGDILLPGVTPNAAKDQEWRQEVNHGYSGILAGAVVITIAFPAFRGLLVTPGKLMH